MGNYINDYLQYLIPDDLSYLVPDFQQRMVPIINQKTYEVISILSKQSVQGSNNETKKQLRDVELSGPRLEFKDRALRGHINRFVSLARQAKEEANRD